MELTKKGEIITRLSWGYSIGFNLNLARVGGFHISCKIQVLFHLFECVNIDP
jgi:hypothetical protein